MTINYINDLRRYERYLRNNSRCPVDYSYKSTILKHGLEKAIKKISLCNHLNILSDLTGEYYTFSLSSESINYWFDSLADKFGFCSILEADRINHATFERTRRLKRRVESIISYPSLFLTLTFTNNVLFTTSLATRRRYVARFLKSITSNYVANIDFGSKKGREHYHALVQVESVDHTLWRYGAINFERVSYDSTKTTDKLSEYVSKLTNHAIKKTTRRFHLIYPKNF